jgi:hypothetical protein
MYPKWDFWFENLPSGNPGQSAKLKGTKERVTSYDFVKNVA